MQAQVEYKTTLEVATLGRPSGRDNQLSYSARTHLRAYTHFLRHHISTERNFHTRLITTYPLLARWSFANVDFPAKRLLRVRDNTDPEIPTYWWLAFHQFLFILVLTTFEAFILK